MQYTCKYKSSTNHLLAFWDISEANQSAFYDNNSNNNNIGYTSSQATVKTHWAARVVVCFY